jgi:hypothetical protein
MYRQETIMSPSDIIYGLWCAHQGLQTKSYELTRVQPTKEHELTRVVGKPLRAHRDLATKYGALISTIGKVPRAHQGLATKYSVLTAIVRWAHRG